MDNLCISSLVVQADPSKLKAVSAAIQSLDGADVMGEDPKGKLVVVLDTGSNRISADLVTEINHIDGVLSAALVYQFDDEKSEVEETR